MAEKFKRKLTITDQKELVTFKKDGKDVTIYEVEAISETGEKVEQPLRSFDADLPKGDLIEFEISPYEHEKYGRTYTLKSPTKGRASKKDISDMQRQITDLANRISQVESELGQLKAGQRRDKGLDEEDIPF